PPHVASWDRATHYLDDRGALHAFATAPTRTLTDTNGRALTLAMVPDFQSVGMLETDGAQVRGWYNALLAPAPKLRVALVRDERGIAWAERVARPDVAARLQNANAAAGFAADLPPRAAGDVAAILVIDARIGVVLPRQPDSN